MFNANLDRINDYPFSRLADLLSGISPRANTPPILMAVGEPQKQPPAFLHEIVARKDDGWSRYPPVQGSPEFRAACANWLTRRYRLPKGMIDPEKHISPVAGTREGLFIAAFLSIGRADGGKPVHANQIGATKVVMPMRTGVQLDVLQKDVNLIREAGALAQINHPNFGWSLTGADLAAVKNANFVEIWNGHPQVNNLGGGGVASAETMWDEALTAGNRLFAIADDDAHHFIVNRLADPTAAAPGRGWIYVRAASLSQADILAAMAKGDFYASNGVEFTDIQAGATGLTVTIKADPISNYRIEFVGAGGKVLAESTDVKATYTFKPGDVYVRARVFESNGKRAWTQPAFASR